MGALASKVDKPLAEQAESVAKDKVATEEKKDDGLIKNLA
jgi:hypothetical protein